MSRAVWLLLWTGLAALVLFGFGHGWDSAVQTVIGWLGGVVSTQVYLSHQAEKRRRTRV